MTTRVSLVAALLVLAAAVLPADDVQPVQLQIKELPSGLFDVQWSVPKVISPQAIPSPLLPEQCRPDGESVFVDRPGAWLTRQTYRCPDGLAGQEVGVRHPGYNFVLSTLLRVELQTGDRYAQMLYPGEDRWRIPAATASGMSETLRAARAVTLAGVDHLIRGLGHLLLLAAVCMLGDLRTGVRLVTAFLLGQLAALTAGSLLGIAIDPVVGELGVAVAALVLAAQALRLPGDRSQLALVAGLGGACHGLAVPTLAVDLNALPDALQLVLFVLGMDAVFLLLAVGLTSSAARLPSRPLTDRLRRAAVSVIGGVAVAFVIGGLIDGGGFDAAENEPRLELPRLLSGAGGTAVPGSRRLATAGTDAAIQSFVSIEAFEIRHEVLVRLEKVADLVGVAPGAEVPITTQTEIKERVLALVAEHVVLTIDGEARPPSSTRVDFLTVTDTGVLPRPAPVVEIVTEAWIGFTSSYLTPTTARELTLRWTEIDRAPEIPLTVTDPESTVTAALSPGEPEFVWINELTEDPVPRVSTTAVEPVELVLPIASLALLVIAAVLTTALARRKGAASAAVAARLMLVTAVVLGPVATWSVALPPSMDSTPSTAEAARILSRVLPNVYRAFEFREEGAVFDRLAMAVTGDTLTEIYLDHRKVLEMEERGGARAQVQAVEVLEVGEVVPGDPSGFTTRAVWTVGGMVTHFGHRHFRQNRYDARIRLVPDGDVWKIASVEILDETRLR